MIPKKSFKVALNTAENQYTGTIGNANFPVDLTKIIVNNEDFDKKYKMTFSFRSATDTNSNIISDNPVYMCINLSNGANNKILTTNSLNNGGVGILSARIDSQSTYVKNYQLVISSTTAPSTITLSSINSLVIGQTVNIVGTTTNNLVAGSYIVNTIVGNNITLFECPVLTTGAVSTMNLYYNITLPVNRYGFLEGRYLDNPPTYIETLKNITSINISVYSGTGLMSSFSSWVCILHFEEI